MNLIDIKSPADLKGLSLAELTDPTVVAINAGTPGGFGFNAKWRKEAGKQYIDVGIAEEHAIAMSSGIAKEFHDRYDATELLKENGVSLEQIVADAKQILSV